MLWGCCGGVMAVFWGESGQWGGVVVGFPPARVQVRCASMKSPIERTNTARSVRPGHMHSSRTSRNTFTIRAEPDHDFLGQKTYFPRRSFVRSDSRSSDLNKSRGELGTSHVHDSRTRDLKPLSRRKPAKFLYFSQELQPSITFNDTEVTL